MSRSRATRRRATSQKSPPPANTSRPREAHRRWAHEAKGTILVLLHLAPLLCLDVRVLALYGALMRHLAFTKSESLLPIHGLGSLTRTPVGSLACQPAGCVLCPLPVSVLLLIRCLASLEGWVLGVLLCRTRSGVGAHARAVASGSRALTRMLKRCVAAYCCFLCLANSSSVIFPRRWRLC